MKIRGFNKTLEKWVYVTMKDGKLFEGLEVWYDIDPGSEGMSTLCHDISCQEIFAGDIIESHLNGKILAQNMIVEFGTYQAYCPVDHVNMDSIGFYVSLPGHPDMPVGPLEEYAKVIGNKYDTPDLIPTIGGKPDGKSM